QGPVAGSSFRSRGLYSSRQRNEYLSVLVALLGEGGPVVTPVTFVVMRLMCHSVTVGPSQGVITPSRSTVDYTPSTWTTVMPIRRRAGARVSPTPLGSQHLLQRKQILYFPLNPIC